MTKNLKLLAKLLIGLILINFSGNHMYQRLDLTHDKRYTLKKASKSVVQNLKFPVGIKVYLKGEFPAEFKRLQIETNQFLEELRAINSNIKIQFINPDTFRESLLKK